MGLKQHAIEVLHNQKESGITLRVIHKDVYHRTTVGEISDTLQIHADKHGYVAICTTTTTETGEETKGHIPLTLEHIPILSEMISKVTEELGGDIQKYIQEGEEMEREYLEKPKWTLDDVESLFELSGVSEDFCVTVHDDKIVCGGWNRAYLYPDGELKVSGSHSTLKFLEVANQLEIELT